MKFNVPTKCLLVILLLQSSGCEEGNKHFAVEGKFSGHWGRTNWTWTFSKGNEFKLTSKGELGDKVTNGEFLQFHDTIYLQFLKDDIRPMKRRTNTLDTIFFESGNCIISGKDDYDYCKPKDSTSTYFSKKLK